MEKTTQQTQSNIARIVFFGPESTGKTTLAKRMALHFNTQWVPEFTREFLQEKYDKSGQASEVSDIKPIVEGQLKTENLLIKDARQYLFCDTNPLEIYVYAKVYFQNTDFLWLDKLNKKLKYTHYFLTYIDTPWEADGLRDKPDERQEMFKAFYDELTCRNKNFTILRGDLETRIRQVLKTLKDIEI